MIKAKEALALVDFLNSLLEIDRAAMQRLIAQRVSCNKKLANHPTVQVISSDGMYSIGLLGILNGYLGAIDDGHWAGWGAILAEYNYDMELVRFKLLSDEEGA